ncbi:MAG: S41 family peptidase [Sphingorhabdus sp.]
MAISLFFRYSLASALATSSLTYSASAKADVLPDGSWEQRGYSRLVEMQNGKHRSYIIGSTFCTEEPSDEMYILDTIKPNGPNSVISNQKGQKGELTFDRIESIPPNCKDKSSYLTKDPGRNFDVFWQMFYENYKFFDLHRVDWQAVYRTQRAKVTPQTTDDQLWAIMKESLKDIRDGHVVIYRMVGDKEISWSAERDSSYFHAIEEMAKANKIPKEVMDAGHDEQDIWVEKQVPAYVKNEILKGKFETAFNDKLLWGVLPGKIGYVSLTSMKVTEDEAVLPPHHVEVERLHKILDQQIMPLMRKQKGVVLDVRFNGGGRESTALAFASRFAGNAACVGYTRQAPAGKMHSLKQKIYTGEPGPNGPFEKPVVVLMSPESASATDTFLMAMRVQPNTRLVGETSEGILSDGWPAMLPNGWYLGLSNEIFIAADGVNYEGKGIPPDDPVPVFKGPDLFKNLASSTQKGISVLKNMSTIDLTQCRNSK